jgi:hypothetical protein
MQCGTGSATSVADRSLTSGSWRSESTLHVFALAACVAEEAGLSLVENAQEDRATVDIATTKSDALALTNMTQPPDELSDRTTVPTVAPSRNQSAPTGANASAPRSSRSLTSNALSLEHRLAGLPPGDVFAVRSSSRDGGLSVLNIHPAVPAECSRSR